jgi:hypothetical protein
MEISIIPRWILKRFVKDPERQLHVNILLSTLLILVFIKPIAKIPHFCLFQEITNIPCPGCNLTGSLYFLLKFQILRSIAMHPVGILIGAYYVLQFPMRILASIDLRRSRIVNNCSKYFSLVIITSIMLVWIINIIFYLRR